MANYSPNCSEALQITEKMEMVDSEVISKVFKKLIDKGIQAETIDIKVPKDIVRTELLRNMEINDYIDQFIYYRNLRGYTLDEVGQAIGVSGKYYWKYEKRLHKLTDMDRIQKIAEFLEIKEELILHDIENKNYKIDKKELKEYLKENKITNSEFSRLIGISRRTIVDWFNTDTEISTNSCQKIQEFLSNFENRKIIDRVG